MAECARYPDVGKWAFFFSGLRCVRLVSPMVQLPFNQPGGAGLQPKDYPSE